MMGCKTQKGDVPMYQMQHNMVENISKIFTQNVFFLLKNI
jgi:hypothetical protein